LTETQIAIAAAAFLIAGIVKGAVGIGQMTTAVAILGLGLDLRAAVPLLIVPALVSNLWQTTRGTEAPAMLKRFALANLAGGIGIALGTAILFAIEPALLSAALGILVAAYAALTLARFDPVAPPSVERWGTPPMAFVSGILTGATGSLHLLLAAWFAALKLPREAYIQAVGLTFLIASLFWAGSLFLEGALSLATIAWSAAGLVPTFAGMALGGALRGRVSESAFRTGLMIFLLVLSASLVWKAVGRF
jgi:uncharacterized membrane protein YfcA